MVNFPNKNPYDSSRESGSSHPIVPMDAQDGFGGGLAEFPDGQVMVARTEPPGVTPSGISLAMFLRAKWWVLGVFAVVSAVALPCVWMFVTPQYKAWATIRVSPVVSRIVFRTEDNGIVPLYTSFVNTQASVILGSTVLQRVLDRDDVRQSRWYKEPRQSFLASRISPLERLRAALIVRPRHTTELIDVSLKTYDPGDAKLIVDAVVDSYKTYTDETLRQNDIRRLETLVRERDTLQKEIDGLVAMKFRLTEMLGTVDPESYRARQSVRLDEMEAERDSLQRSYSIEEWVGSHRAGAETTVDATGDSAWQTPASDPATEATARRYSTDLEWRALNRAMGAAKDELSLSAHKYGELHPRIRDLSAGVENADRRVREREYQLDEEWLTLRPFGLAAAALPAGRPELAPPDAGESGRERLAQEVELLDEDIERMRTGLADAGEIAKEVAHYKEELRYKRELYEMVRQRLTAFEMESKAPARITIADYAVKPWAPSRDRRVVLSAMTLFGAMMLGLGVGFLRDTVDPRIHEEADVYAPVQVPFLGKLPLLSGAPCLSEDPDPMVAESIRMVRTALLRRLGASGGKVVRITSSVSRAGKTSVPVLLTRSLAKLGKKTLLVEADLRRPSIADRMGFVADFGLAAVLTGTIEAEEVIVSTPIANLDVLPAGSRPSNFDFELLANGAFGSCLKRWRESYDFIVLDSPPVFPVADARILASQVDGTIMVLRSAHCRRTDVFQAYTDLIAGGGKVVGTVFIGANSEAVYGDYAEGRQYLETV